MVFVAYNVITQRPQFATEVDTQLIGETKWSCCWCGAEVRYRRGNEFRKSHFYHLSLAETTCQSDFGSEQKLELYETNRRQILQNGFHRWWQSQFPASWLEVTKQIGMKLRRADVVLEKINVVLEIQHSNITKKLVAARTADYKFLEYDVFWILDCWPLQYKQKLAFNEETVYYTHKQVDIKHFTINGQTYGLMQPLHLRGWISKLAALQDHYIFLDTGTGIYRLDRVPAASSYSCCVVKYYDRTEVLARLTRQQTITDMTSVDPAAVDLSDYVSTPEHLDLLLILMTLPFELLVTTGAGSYYTSSRQPTTDERDTYKPKKRSRGDKILWKSVLKFMYGLEGYYLYLHTRSADDHTELESGLAYILHRLGMPRATIITFVDLLPYYHHYRSSRFLQYLTTLATTGPDPFTLTDIRELTTIISYHLQ